ncbi:MAG: protein-glutamate O-methyltransferase CheR [Nitrospirae bacterium]|nr:protein-glutamate O-methyltransferase CheR [Candidatus Manganitrophaceae bacterium]
MVSKESLTFIFSLLQKESGLILDSSKTYLVEARLEPIVAGAGLPSIDALCQHLRTHPGSPLRQSVVDAMATNETSFFRDMIPFEVVKNVILPGLLTTNQKSRQIRIWSAACATGQEPYSLAMLLCTMKTMLEGWKVEILATDLVERVLDRARAGVYSQYEIQRGLPAPYMTRFFEQTDSNWRVKVEVKKWIEFRQLNLLSDFRFLGPFDIIFCRNILIYLDLPLKKAILERMADCLTPNGMLFLGGGETSLGITDIFTRTEVDRAVYYKKNDGHSSRPLSLRPEVLGKGDGTSFQRKQ